MNRCTETRPLIEFEWVSTPALWAAYREGYCGCEECRGRIPVGYGKTPSAAEADLLEKEDE
jgi:hypothetical protein